MATILADGDSDSHASTFRMGSLEGIGEVSANSEHGNGAAVETYGVTRRFDARSWLDEATEELSRLGYTICPNVIATEKVGHLKSLLDEIYAEQQHAAGGANALAQIGDANLVRLPLAFRREFLDVAAPAKIMALAKRVLGDNFVLLMQNGVINPPDAPFEQRRYHRDLNYQHWVASRPIAFNFLICLDAFTTENGASFVLPGSHLHEEFPSDAFVRRHELQLCAPAGAAIVMNAMTYHRAGPNRSASARYGINQVVGSPMLAQQIDTHPPATMRSLPSLTANSTAFAAHSMTRSKGSATN